MVSLLTIFQHANLNWSRRRAAEIIQTASSHTQNIRYFKSINSFSFEYVLVCFFFAANTLSSPSKYIYVQQVNCQRIFAIMPKHTHTLADCHFLGEWRVSPNKTLWYRKIRFECHTTHTVFCKLRLKSIKLRPLCDWLGGWCIQHEQQQRETVQRNTDVCDMHSSDQTHTTHTVCSQQSLGG